MSRHYAINIEDRDDRWVRWTVWRVWAGTGPAKRSCVGVYWVPPPEGEEDFPQAVSALLSILEKPLMERPLPPQPAGS